MKKLFLLYIIQLSLLFTACEEVVNIPLNNAEPAVVIEGTITNIPAPHRVIMSQTTDYYNPGMIKYLSGALIFVKDSQDHYWYFREKKQGFYVNSQFKGTPGLTYHLQIQWQKHVYNASSVMQDPVPIDSLRVRYFPGSRFADSGYFIIIYFSDPPGKENYYRIKMMKGEKTSTVIHVLNDRLTDGNQILYYLYGAYYQPGDTAIIELQSIDKGVYEYMLTLSNVTAANRFGTATTPANPTTNLSGGALGYFGALAISRDTIVIK
ncbi:MAG TPA: DUF4249 domain-containing protein [Bacteroidetes bacterium]|nr:DUF4249 domain-containing protein [Bacteroidales bacterium]HHJ10305.1 DUF4249 domain-containing protein [Bacteroidota bacterium]